jgi:PAS domain S-box-containing protein
MRQGQEDIWNERFVRLIIDSMADGVFILDPDGRIIFWNDSMTRISGYTTKEALGQTCALLACNRCFGKVCPADFAKCRIVEKGSSGAKECYLQHKLGHEVPVIKHAGVVRDDGGRILGVVETVTDMTELHQARQKAEEASLKLGELHRLDNIIGKSRGMQDVFHAVRMAAASDATVLIQGESGTGKELIAGAIHYNSDRKNHPLVIVNCSALPENLLESELFGHVKGAFTGAIHARIGRFEEADEGTVFLDEIGELSPFIQVKLLRVLQEREIERIGESKKRKINIRVVTATHRDLRDLVAHGRFREDLYYRLHVFPIRVPPLRDRKEDIPPLVRHFIQVFNGRTQKEVVDVSRDVMKIFMEYHWPGNVRELENAMEHAFVLCTGRHIGREDLPEHVQSPGTMTIPSELSGGEKSAKRAMYLSRERLLGLLQEHQWKKAAVAKTLGVSHTAVWKYMKKYGIPLKPGDSVQG